MKTDSSPAPIVLTGCGILAKEVNFLVRKNNWPVETHFLCSSLHVDFDKLYAFLSRSLERFEARETIVLYGSCHPLMEKLLDGFQTFRTEGQNCVEMLLGREVFFRKLEAGTFFLLEDWVRCWEYVTGKTMKTAEIRAMTVGGEHSSFLAIRTPCSGDFTADAEGISASIGIPLTWMDVGLDNLEAVLGDAVHRRLKGGL